MIRTFANKATAALFCGRYVNTLPRHIQATAFRKLRAAGRRGIADRHAGPAGELAGAPAWRAAGQWSIQIHNQWRICFRFQNGEAWDVDIADWSPTTGASMTITREDLPRLDARDVETGEPLAPVHRARSRARTSWPRTGLGHVLAIALRVPAPRINDVVRGRARHLARNRVAARPLLRHDATAPGANLQAAYDLRIAQEKAGEKIERDIQPLTA